MVFGTDPFRVYNERGPSVHDSPSPGWVPVERGYTVTLGWRRCVRQAENDKMTKDLGSSEMG
ncbi:protein of unknown function [Kyrpidia spormannii]|uniref:Uncharacterized protein n=2 Tax=Kyrpidia spormannii TaxID=2055160 RepID=A0ACA8Z7L4_9BACL|nr:protein of unknown function [Kyrpidia spormannii]CAB3392001.1 protein of unknown function [Kyrpidia spormannii]